MKWYKKQMDQLKHSKSVATEPATSSGQPPGLKRPFAAPKMRIKKFIKPLEKRSRPKTDSF
ncbi:MAG: hypothetical protein A3D53_03600 [Candidatus Magasanikbacteria bacterium RIFCSPHIGHO2_02_FULL_45_10]|uniref:Uncharacterized protein n=1 Tax=Candidatus Magasanikbacteria bacterium RIFCSPHIGHO2_02_FULL_45_10 TaxID=1798679 RepID=A0A1F6M9V0_9BACT|nr:MAG: hypothetical protein A3D53_03600 [Candidatus Magasanikbacteria bacterium RIFCSPHIGHO2_02_FULL_45_10]